MQLLMVVTFFAHASGEKCSNEINKLLQKHQSKGEWTQLSSTDGDIVKRSPTSNIGEWVQIINRKSGDKVSIIKPDSMTDYTVDTSCMVKKEVSSHHFLNAKFEKNKKDFFSDQDLKLKMKKNKLGLIYVWSPKFIYSVKEFSAIKKTAESLGYSFHAVMAADDNPEKLNSSSFSHISKDFRRRNASLELLLQKSDLHSPTMFIYKNNKWSAKPLVGVFTKKALEQELKKYL